MKRKLGIRELTGCTQEEMAGLMGISRSYFAMYESGRRNGPLKSGNLINELLMFVSSAEFESKYLSKQSPLHKKVVKKLENSLKQNEIQLLRLKLQIEDAEKKESALARRSTVMEFLKAHHEKTGQPHIAILNYMGLKASESSEANNAEELFFMRLKQKSLEQEKLLLQSELDILSNDNNSKDRQ